MMPRTINLGDAAITVDYGVTASAATAPVGPKFLRITDIQNGNVDWNYVPWCQADTKTVMGSKLAPGDIVFARTGATTGKSFLIRECPENSVFASYLIRLRLKNSFDPRFVYHYFQTPSYWTQIIKSIRGVAQPGVNATTLRSLAIPAFPLAEQKRIAEILDRAEALRANRRAALALLDELTQSIFLDMFGDLANPKCILGVLGEHLSFMTTGGRGWAEYYCNQGSRFIRSLDVQMNDISDSDPVYVDAPNNAEAKRTRVCGGDVLLTMTGSRIGRVATADDSLDGAYISQHVAILRLREALIPQFLSRFLSLESCGQVLIRRMQYGQTKPGLNFVQVRSFQVPVPPIESQRRFVAIEQEIKRVRARLAHSLDRLAQLFASLQHRAFRGEL